MLKKSEEGDPSERERALHALEVNLNRIEASVRTLLTRKVAPQKSMKDEDSGEECEDMQDELDEIVARRKTLRARAVKLDEEIRLETEGVAQERRDIAAAHAARSRTDKAARELQYKSADEGMRSDAGDDLLSDGVDDLC